MKRRSILALLLLLSGVGVGHRGDESLLWVQWSWRRNSVSDPSWPRTRQESAFHTVAVSGTTLTCATITAANAAANCTVTYDCVCSP